VADTPVGTTNDEIVISTEPTLPVAETPVATAPAPAWPCAAPIAVVPATPVIVNVVLVVIVVVPTAPDICGEVTEELAFAAIEALPTEPVAATPVTAMLESVKTVTGLTLPFNWLVANVAVAPAATDTPLTTAEPCTEPRVSPL
tara:strand:- start:81 stop:512 length:432 start_codon:yes stop_codon:yes gene_type:complete